MRVVGIARVGAIFPEKRASEAFALQFGDEFRLVHGGIVAQEFEGKNGYGGAEPLE